MRSQITHPGATNSSSFCSVKAVQTVWAYTPKCDMAFTSAMIPAPALPSKPPMHNAYFIVPDINSNSVNYNELSNVIYIKERESASLFYQ